MSGSTLKINKLASGTSEIIVLNPNELDLSLLEILRSENLPIASSCDGQGVCHKCVINGSQLSCKITAREFLEENNNIDIAYL